MLSFPPGTKMVHFPGFASHTLLDSGADAPILFGASLEDSDVPGSQPVCGSPRLIAAYHVLLRLPSPRHPPYALSSLTIKFAPPETLKASQARALLWPLCLCLYPSLSDCQRSIPVIPETNSSSLSRWFQAQDPDRHRSAGFFLVILNGSKISERPRLRAPDCRAVADPDSLRSRLQQAERSE